MLLLSSFALAGGTGISIVFLCYRPPSSRRLPFAHAPPVVAAHGDGYRILAQTLQPPVARGKRPWKTLVPLLPAKISNSRPPPDVDGDPSPGRFFRVQDPPTRTADRPSTRAICFYPPMTDPTVIVLQDTLRRYLRNISTYLGEHPASTGEHWRALASTGGHQQACSSDADGCLLLRFLAVILAIAVVREQCGGIEGAYIGR